jgi:hypothetical protein
MASANRYLEEIGGSPDPQTAIPFRTIITNRIADAAASRVFSSIP